MRRLPEQQRLKTMFYVALSSVLCSWILRDSNTANAIDQIKPMTNVATMFYLDGRKLHAPSQVCSVENSLPNTIADDLLPLLHFPGHRRSQLFLGQFVFQIHALIFCRIETNPATAGNRFHLLRDFFTQLFSRAIKPGICGFSGVTALPGQAGFE